MIKNRLIRNAKKIDQFLISQELDLTSTSDSLKAFQDRDIIIIATPTNYDESQNSFDTSSVETTIKRITEVNSMGSIVIKSTVPVGFTEMINAKFKTDRVLFSPEFLREGKALHDNLYPSRIIVGGNQTKSKIFADIFSAI